MLRRTFGPNSSGASAGGLNESITVDVFTPGCPTRPEALMEAIIKVQEKILETS